MRIAILTHNYPMNSGERKDAGVFLYDFAHELAKTHKVFVFCPNFEGKKEKYKKVPVYWYAWAGGKKKLGSWSAFSPASPLLFFNLIRSGKKEIIKFCKENKIDYCLAAWSMPSGVFAYEAKKKLNIPYAVWALGSDINKYTKFPILRSLIGTSFKNADAAYANSRLLAAKVKNIYRVNPEFMPAITDFARVEATPRNLSRPQTHFLYVARLEKVKGPDLLLSAATFLKNRTKLFHIHMLGDGSMRKSLETFIKRKGLESYVTLYGNADKRTVSSFMKSSNYLVIPSRNESLPLVLLEAAQSSLPIIATDVGDCRRLITKHSCGYIVSKKDPRVLSTVLYKALSHKKETRKKSVKGLRSIAKEYTQERAVSIFNKNLPK